MNRLRNRDVHSCDVCVIGGAGFLGSHLVDHLIEDRDCRVLVLDNLEAGSRDFVHPNSTMAIFEKFDVCSDSLYDALIERYASMRFDPKYFFNYAAIPYLPDSYKDPTKVFQTNALGALNVIVDAGRWEGCEGIVQVSSSEVYDQLGAIDEESFTCARSTYGASKLAIDYLVQARWKEAETPVIAIRQFNCVGARETHPYVVPEIIGQLWKEREKGKDTCTVRLGNNTLRDFSSANDAVRYAVHILEYGDFGEVYNLGSGKVTAIYDLVPKIAHIMGIPKWKIELDLSRARAWEIWSMCADMGKTIELLPDALKNPNNGISSRINGIAMDRLEFTPLEKALEECVKWYESQGARWPWEPTGPNPEKKVSV